MRYTEVESQKESSLPGFNCIGLKIWMARNISITISAIATYSVVLLNGIACFGQCIIDDPVILPNSWFGNFMKMHCCRRVFINFQHQEIR